MPRGRKPKPTSLHELHGDPSHLRTEKLRRRAAAEPPSGLPEAPADFTAEQRALWQSAIENAPPGILRRIDASALAVWVIAYDVHRQARERLQRSSLLLLQSRDPNSDAPPIPSPLLSILNRQAAIVLKSAEQLGFTPVARPRLYAANGPLAVRGSKPLRAGQGARKARPPETAWRRREADVAG